MKPSILLSILIGAIVGRVSAQLADTNRTSAYETSISQESLRVMTIRLKTDMIALLDEFSQYRSASDDLTKLREAVDQLDHISERDMISVVRILREASRSESAEDAKAKLLQASSGQKEIQNLLRTISDRLALQKDAASVKQRLQDLARRQLSNLRDTKELASEGVQPDRLKNNLKKLQELNQEEQQAIRKEIEQAMDSLKKLSEDGESPDKEQFMEVRDHALREQIQTRSMKTEELLKTDFQEAAKTQQEIADGLLDMVSDLQSMESREEQTRELAAETEQLAAKQEQLAEASHKDGKNERTQIEKAQGEISDQLQIVKRQLETINPDAAKLVKQAGDNSEEITQAMKSSTPGVMADAQKEVAQKLKQAGGLLEKQADAIAAAKIPPAQDNAKNATSRAAAAAINQVNSALADISQAKQQPDAGAAGKDLDEAAASLEIARENMEGISTPALATELKAAAAAARSAKNGENQKEKLEAAQASAEQALASLEQAAGPLVNPMDKSGMPGNAGEIFDESQLPTPGVGQARSIIVGPAVSALSDGRSGPREALSLLQQEKTPTEYETMVRQYIRNLAEAADQDN